MPLNKYAPQAHTHRRTQSSILAGTKHLIATVGVTKMTMIEIADTSEVSRATLYNHFRDKESVILALCQSECTRLISSAKEEPNATDALEMLSIQVSTDSALAHMRAHDPAHLALGVSATHCSIWADLTDALVEITGSHVLSDLSLRWLMGQVFHPLTPQDSRLQAELLISRANL